MSIEWTECELIGGSELTHRFQTCGDAYFRTLMASFAGTWGNPDGNYIRVLSHAAVEIFGADALILDFRRLAYTWGDEMVLPFCAGQDVFFRQFVPVVAVVSDLCREGLTSLVEYEFHPAEDGTKHKPSELLFESEDEALAAVKREYDAHKERA